MQAESLILHDLGSLKPSGRRALSHTGAPVKAIWRCTNRDSSAMQPVWCPLETLADMGMHAKPVLTHALTSRDSVEPLKDRMLIRSVPSHAVNSSPACRPCCIDMPPSGEGLLNDAFVIRNGLPPNDRPNS